MRNYGIGRIRWTRVWKDDQETFWDCIKIHIKWNCVLHSVGERMYPCFGCDIHALTDWQKHMHEDRHTHRHRDTHRRTYAQTYMHTYTQSHTHVHASPLPQWHTVTHKHTHTHTLTYMHTLAHISGDICNKQSEKEKKNVDFRWPKPWKLLCTIRGANRLPAAV